MGKNCTNSMSTEFGTHPQSQSVTISATPYSLRRHCCAGRDRVNPPVARITNLGCNEDSADTSDTENRIAPASSHRAKRQIRVQIKIADTGHELLAEDTTAQRSSPQQPGPLTGNPRKRSAAGHDPVPASLA